MVLPFIAFISNRVTQTGRLSLGGELGKKKSSVPFRIKLADITLKVTVLLILILDKSHNGWYLGCSVPPCENTVR